MQKKVRILIVEDEFITLDMLRDYLENSGYEVSGDAMRAEEALAVLEQGDTDLALLDINIKGTRDGIWLGEQIREKYQIPFIFISANSDADTIRRASDTLPSAYLVKPFSQVDVFSAIEVALKNYAKNHQKNDRTPWTDGEEMLLRETIFVRDNNCYKKIKIADIQYIEAFKNYIELHFGHDRIVIRSSLQKFLSILSEKDFMQVHRSFIVNVKYVEEIHPNTVSIGKNTIPVSKNYREALNNKFSFFL